MKQTITTQRKSPGQHYLRLYGLILTFLLAGIVGLQAQTAGWDTGFPKLSPTTLNALGDPGYIDVTFTPQVKNVAQAKVEVTLPAGVSYDGAVDYGTGHTTGIIIGTPASVGQIVTITFSSNGGTLNMGSKVALRIKVKADCSAVSGAMATVKVLSNATVITSSQKDVAIGVQIPTVRATSTAASKNYTSQTQLQNYEVSLDATNGEATSFKLTLTGDKTTTLSNFMLDGTGITPTSVNVVSGSTSTTVITLTKGVNMTGALDATIKKLTFDAGNSVCGSHTIGISAQYPAASNCKTNPGVTLTMNFPAEPGAPYFDYVSGGYYDAIDGNVINAFQAPKDLTTITYLKFVFKNTGNADSYTTLFNNIGFYRTYMNYIDADDIKYSIDGGPLKAVTSAMLSGGDKVTSSQAVGFVQTQYQDKYFRRNLTITDVIAKDKEITLWVPGHLGNIYDNTGKMVSYDYIQYEPWCLKADPIAANRCNVWGGKNETYYRAKPLVTDPHFREIPPTAAFHTGDVWAQEIRWTANNLSTNAATYNVAEFVIEMPDWMDLNGAPEAAITLKSISGTAYASAYVAGSAQTYPVSGGLRKYSIQFANVNNQHTILNVEYLAGACQSPNINQIGQIRYSINWYHGSSASTHLMENISQVFQDVTMLCKKDGVVLDGFKAVRTTIGLKDLNNDGVPDDGTLADPADIRHDYYILDDNGYLKWNATINGLTTDTYQYWYAPVTLTEMNLSQMVPTGASATISINGGAPIPVQYTKVDNYKFYLSYDAGSQPLKGTDKIEVHLPFTIKATNDRNYYLTTECFVSKTIPIGDPFATNPNRQGEDVAATRMGLYSDDMPYTIDGVTPVFTNNAIKADFYWGTIRYFNESYPLGYFPTEVRRKYYPVKLTWELPEGYIMNNGSGAATQGDLKMNYSYTKNNNGGTLVSGFVVPLASVSNNAYEYDYSAIFNEGHTEAAPTLAAGQLVVPDDRWVINFTPSVQATKGAPVGASTAKQTIILKNLITGALVTKTLNMPMVYNGDAMTLALSTNSLPAYGSNMTVPAVKIGNAGKNTIQDVWLYVDGNVSNLSATQGGTTIPAEGSVAGVARWIKVAASMTAGQELSYALNFKYGGSSDCSTSDKVKVYTFSGFSAGGWTPNTSAAADLTDVDHLGATRELTITSAPASMVGSISVPSPSLTFGTAYTVEMVMDATGSEGALKDPQIVLVVPAGQDYVAGSAKVAYPFNMTPAVSSALNTAFLAMNPATREITVSLGSNFLLPGYLATGTDDDRKVKITAQFTPNCATVLTGIRYTGTLAGQTACGNVAEGSGTKVFSESLYPANLGAYSFQVTADMKDGNRAFNEQKTTGILKLTLRKLTGPTDNMNASDYLLVTLPEKLDLQGTASITSGIGTGAVTTLDDQIVSGERQLKLSLPVTAYNAAVNKGVNTDVIYEIPIVYSPTAQDMAAAPEQLVSISVTTSLQFHSSCPTAPASIGHGEMGVALVTAQVNPVIACKNTPAALEITSTGFQGSWHKEFARTTVLAATPDYSYTPTVQQDTTFHVSAIFGGVDYGTVPVKVQMNPLVSLTVSNPSDICLGSSVDLKLAVTGSTNSTDTVYLASDKSTVVANPLLTPTAVGVATYYILTKNTTTGCVSDTMTVTFNVNTKPAVAPITLPAAICEGSALTLPTLTVTAQGTPVTAQVWKLAGTAYTAGTLLTYADNGKSLTFTASSACGDSIVTVGNLTVNAKPTVAPITLPAAICEGSALTLPTPTVAARGTAITAQTWKLAGTAYTAGTALTYADNGKSLTFTASSACGDSIVTVGNITVNAKPTVAPITLPTAICEGSALTLPTPTVAARGTAITAQTWKLAGTAYTAGTTLTYADNGKSLTFTASSACGDSIVTVGNIIVNAKPTVAPITLPAAICEGSALTLPTPTVAARGTAITAQTWKLNNVAYTAGTLLTYADNGKSLTFTASSACGDSIITVGNITVNAKPTVAPITLPAAICEGSALALPTPTVAARGTAITAQTWKLAGTAYTAGTLLTYADNGKSLTFTASSACGDSIVTVGNITVNAKPTVAPITLPAAICAGNALALPTPTVAARGTAITAQTWKLNGVAYTPGTNLAYSDNGKSLTFTASSACGDSVVTVGNITVYQTTAINTQPSVPAGIKLSNGYIIPGSIVPLSVAAVGHNLTYQWYWKKASDGSTVTLSDNSKYTGSTTASLTINNAYDTENGDYYVTVTGTCNTVTSTPVTIVAVANQDASLKDLKVNGTTLSDFNPGKTDYLLAISCDDEQVTILGTPNFAGVTSITGNGTFALQPGDNYFPITVVAQDMVTTRTYTVNVVRNCYVPKIKKDLDDAVICLNGTHTWTIEAEGENLTYEWYKGETRIMGQNSPSITFTDAKFSDYDRYYVVVRSNHNGFKSSIQSKKVRLWVADYLPEHLHLSEYPNPATVGKNYHLKVDGYVDVTKYSWSYSKSGVTFSPAVTLYNDNETWATFGSLSVGTGTLKVTMEHPCGTRELTQTITVNYPTGVDDVTATVVTVYPNPTSGILKVSGTVANQMIRVTDVTGSLKGSYKTQEGITTIDLTGYAKGTYLVQYNGKAYKVIRK